MRRPRWLMLVFLVLLPGIVLAQDATNADAVANGVVISQAHYFIASSDGASLRVAEFYLIGNTGDHVYEGLANADGPRMTLTFTLPESARNLRFDGPGLGERYVGDSTRFADTRPIPSGAAVVEVAFSYELPFTGRRRIERALGVPVVSAAFIVSGEELDLTGPGLTPEGTMDTLMGQATTYSAGPFADGETLTFTLVSQSVTGSHIRDIGLGIGALLVAGVVSYRLWRPVSVSPPPETALPFLEAIAALDARYVAGDLPEEAYHRERETLKQQLLAQFEEDYGR